MFWHPFKRRQAPANPAQEEHNELTATDWKAFIGAVEKSRLPVNGLIDDLLQPRNDNDNRKYGDSP